VADCGAESIAFLKIYGVLPAATVFIAAYTKLASITTHEHDRPDNKQVLFYITCVPFFIFFYIFDRIIYPHRELIEPKFETVTSLLELSLGRGRHYNYNDNDNGDNIGGYNDGGGGGAMIIVAKLITHWTSALYYIIAEVYSSVSVGILFWQYANDVVSVNQAPRFYPLFAQMSGLAPIVAGQYVVRYASCADDFRTSLYRVTNLVTLSGIMICLFYRWSNIYIHRTEASSSSNISSSSTTSTETIKKKTKKKKKTKMTMMESTKFLASSEYLRLIATLVLGYGLSINFTEIIWKSCVKRQYPDPLDYQRFMGNFSSIVGLSTCIVIFLGVHAIRILGWRIGALATPTAMGILAVPYFLSILVGLDSPHRLRIAVIFGTVQSLISKTTKYALFDPTTQMAYIPLDEESKVKGKAAIEVLGSRIGKSGGSLIQQVLVLMFGNIISAAPILAVLYYAVLGWWAYSANRLSSLFYARTAAAAQEEEQREKKKD
jgi:AAA family ATP:ADP antiporter